MHGIAAVLLCHLPLVSYPYRGELRPCNLCGEDRAAVVCRYDRRLKPLTTIKCDGCGLLRTDPMPTEDELAHYYASAYRLDYQFARRDTPPRVHLRRSRTEAVQRMQLLSGLLRPTSRLLDFGSGSGEFMDLAAKAGHDIIGIEPGQDFARFAQEAYGARVLATSWQEAAVPEASFDLITAHHVLEHLREPVDALSRMADWLAEGGVIHVEVPNAEAERADPLQQFHFAHVHHFSPRTLLRAAKIAGLELDPRVPPKGTTMVFRKRHPGSVRHDADPPGAPVVDLSSLSPGRYLASGLWASNALRRLNAFRRDMKLSRSRGTDTPAIIAPALPRRPT